MPLRFLALGSVRTTGDLLNLGNVTVVGASSLETAGANLILSGLTSTGNQAVDVSSGAITVSGAVDDVALTIKDSAGATFQSQVGSGSAVSLVIENTTAGQDITINGEKREIETVVLYLTGDIDLRQVSKLANKMDVPGGKQLQKVNDKN